MNTETYGNDRFSALIDSYQNLVFSICYKITSDYFASEDLTQDTFLSVYQHLSSFDGTNAKAWICRIATNKCIDYLKKSETKCIPISDEEVENNINLENKSLDTYKDPQQSVLDNEIKRTLAKRCQSLKPPYDEIARLYYVEELEATEISKIKCLKLKTVQTQIYRAREMLRKKYKEDKRYE